jgi:hypothetical protein
LDGDKKSKVDGGVSIEVKGRGKLAEKEKD